MTRTVVVIGGGAAGMSAASAARRTDPESSITVLEAGPFASYGVCGLPYFISGVVPEANSLVAMPPEEFRDKRRIDLRLGATVDRIDRDAQVVYSGSQAHPFDVLVLASGAAPIVPPIPGVEDPRVVTIRRLDEAISLRDRLSGVKRAVVVGAGYVGLEMAEALVEQGIEVTVVDRLPRVMSTVDVDIAELVEREVRQHCELRLESALVALHPSADSVRVELDSGSLDVDLVVLALGVRPSTDILKDFELPALPNGALVVDDHMRTPHPNVLAAGDCIALHHRVLNGPAFVPLGPAANKTGRVAGTVAAGGDAAFEGIVGTAVVKVFDLTVAHTGLTLADAQAAGFEAVATDITAKSRAKYYPGAEPLRVRLVHQADGKLLGGQLVGRDGAAQRVDVIAAALHTGLGIDELAAFDLAYAPPFSPVYDPLTQAAQAAQFAMAKGSMAEGSMAKGSMAKTASGRTATPRDGGTR